MKLATWFEGFTKATGETPHSIVFGPPSPYDDAWPDTTPGSVCPFGDVQASVLKREFDDGYGGNESPSLCAWSENWVIFNDNYDGAENLCWVPRNPTPHNPIRPGGS